MTQDINFADTEFRDGQLYSKQFSDIYFAADGPAETDRVYLNPAHIIERIGQHDEFTIGEFGFGTGLNFFQTANRVNDECRPRRVRYISFEKNPVSNLVRRHALKRWSSNWYLFDEFCETSPPPVEGWHRRFFFNGRIELSLYLGSIERGMIEFLESDAHGVDAWFLDGFNPSRNPDMWNPNLLSRLHAVTKPRGTVTSFSVSGDVRRSLEKHGFETTRVENAPYKRHTLLASIKSSKFKPPLGANEVRVIGGGFAGTATSLCLARKGISVKLFDKNTELGKGTSRIPMAIQHARLSVANSADSVYRIHAYTFATALVRRLEACLSIGAIQFADDNLSTERLEKITNYIGPEWSKILLPEELEILFGHKISGSAAWFSRSNALRGAELCKELARHPLVEIHHEDVDPSSSSTVPTVIAIGADLQDLRPSPPFESTTLEGQVDRFHVESEFIAENRIVVKNGYAVYLLGEIYAGSTYEYKKWAPGAATTANRNRVESMFEGIELTPISEFRSHRVVNSDRFPIVGLATDKTWYNLGHGSSGSISALFGAELIASQISKEVAPCTRHALTLVDPWRFQERQQRRPNPFKKRSHATS